MAGQGAGLRLSLLGTFAATDHRTDVAMRHGSQRLLGFLALRHCWLGRAFVAGTLWPNSSEDRAGASLRSALARLEGDARCAVIATNSRLRLTDDVEVDFAESKALALRLIETPGLGQRDSDVTRDSIAPLSADLLSGWYDEWVVLEAEEWRQTRLHATEALAGHLAARGQFADAVRAAMAAVRADPLRESPHVTLVQVHLAEGNQSEALRVFGRYRDLLARELSLPPSPRLCALVAGIERQRIVVGRVPVISV